MVAGDFESMLTTNPFDDDKLREECGVFGIWGADNASGFVGAAMRRRRSVQVSFA